MNENEIGTEPSSHAKKFVDDAEKILQFLKYKEGVDRTTKVSDWGLTAEQEATYIELRESEENHPLHEIMCKMLRTKFDS